jgi:hypothetical protein
MLVTAVAVFVGIVAGGLQPPVGHRFARPKVKWPALLVTGVALLAVGTRVDGDTGLWSVLVGYAVLLIGGAVNIHLVGMGVLFLGLATNALVIALNGGMPVRMDALVRAGVAEPGDAVTLSGHRLLEDDESRLSFLDDRIPLPAGGQVISFGDLVLAVGLADATAHITRRRRRDLLADDASEPDPIDATVSRHPAAHAAALDDDVIVASLVAAHLARTAPAVPTAAAADDSDDRPSAPTGPRHLVRSP